MTETQLHPLSDWIDRHSTMDDFACSIGCSRSHLTNILAGRKRPSVDLLSRISMETDGEFGLDAFAREGVQ